MPRLGGRSPYDELLLSTVAKSTRQVYVPAVNRVVDWLRQFSAPSTRRTDGSFFMSPQDINHYLSIYLMHLHRLHDGHSGKGIANNTYFGLLCLYPSLGRSLLTARRCLRGFVAARPVVQHPPLPYHVNVVVALWLTAYYGLEYGIATLVCFDCLFRKEELCKLLVDDVAVTGDPRVARSFRGAFIRLKSTKRGLNQSVTVTDPTIIKLLSVAVSLAKSAGRKQLWSFSSSQYYRAFRRVISLLSLSSRFVVHSIRHGGATHLMTAGVPVNDIMIRGRWKSPESFRTYVQQWQSLLLTNRYPSIVISIGRYASNDIIGALRLVCFD